MGRYVSLINNGFTLIFFRLIFDQGYVLGCANIYGLVFFRVVF